MLRLSFNSLKSPKNISSIE